MNENPLVQPEPVGEIIPGYAWIGDDYVPVWRPYVDGNQHGVWTKERWAHRELRYHLRLARRSQGGA